MIRTLPQEKPQPSRLPSLTLAAAMLTLVLFGALLLNRGNGPDPLLTGLQQDASATAIPSATMTFTATPTHTWTPTAQASATLVPTSTPILIQPVTQMPTVPLPVESGPLDIIPTPVPMMMITPSQLEPIISLPGRLNQSVWLAASDSAKGLDWAGDQLLVAGFRGGWLYPAAQLGGAARILPDEENAGLMSAVLSPDGTLAATLNWKHTLRLWDALSGVHITSLPDAPVWGELRFTPDGTSIYSTLGPGLVTFNLDTGSVKIDQLPTDSSGFFLYSPDGETAIYVAGQSLHILDAASGAPRQQYDDLLPQTPGKLAFNADGSLLAVGTLEGAVYLIDVATGEIRAEIGGQGLVMGLDFSADHLAIIRNASQLNSLWLYDLAAETQTPLVVYDIALAGVAFSADADQIAIIAEDGRLLLLDLE